MTKPGFKSLLTGKGKADQTAGSYSNTLADSGESARWAVRILVLVLVALCALGWYWSREPKIEISANLASQQPVAGAAITSTLIHVVDTLLEKPGGLLSNDIMPPGLVLDNIPNWEYGVIIQVRDLSKAMREAFSRSQSQSTEDKDLALAEPRFNFDIDSWMLPASEKEYHNGRNHLQGYLNRLLDDDEYNAQFYARADNLRYWLSTVETRLGSLSQRLSASVGQKRINIDLAGDSAASQSTPAPRDVIVKTSWAELDDIFYEARGTSWALVHFLKATQVDFADVLAKKNAQVSLEQIIRELEATQAPLHSPMILNGSGFGLLANHSLTMASYISRANAAIIDLRELLSQG
ncbi:MAG: DUF2333 family protein [Gammaproteobacteria bacterium]|nr:DUF2333 family protein [Gammaproteobacteria bacterium]MBQ0840854.1 DUF2333 family protein [Gammaproteobacteria bacterium]